MTLVSLDDIWITANFKETQLREYEGRADPERFQTVDAYGGRKYDVKVTQIGGATGSVLSLFPAGKRDRQLCEGRAAGSCTAGSV